MLLKITHLEVLDDVDDLHDCINKVVEIGKEFKRCHAELKTGLGERYEGVGKRTHYTDKIREYVKKAKARIRALKKLKLEQERSHAVDLEIKKLKHVSDEKEKDRQHAADEREKDRQHQPNWKITERHALLD